MSSAAWVLPLKEKQWVAVGQLEMIHLIHAPEFFRIPKMPRYCRDMVLWQEELVPIMDIYTLIEGNKEPSLYQKETITKPVFYVAIIAYCVDSDLTPNYGGILLTGKPELLTVTNKQSCPLPEKGGKWEEISHSCFTWDKKVIPIINLPILFK